MSAASPLHSAFDSFLFSHFEPPSTAIGTHIPRIAANDSSRLLSDAEWKAPALDLSGKDEQSASL
jgi:hypothetical protein